MTLETQRSGWLCRLASADLLYFLSYGLFLITSLLSTTFYYRWFIGYPFSWLQVCCLVLLILRECRMGATRQEIVENYLLTAENLREMLAEFVAKRPELSLHVVTPRAWYMETFLDRIEERERTH
jgi:hypothetical protein